MNTLVIYDNQGKIFKWVTRGYEIPQGGVQYLEVVIPDGKRLVSVDTSVTPNVAVFEVIPPTESERLTSVEEAITALLGV